MDLPKTVFFFNPISRHIPTSKVMDESRKATAYIDPKFTVQPRACSRKKAFAAAIAPESWKILRKHRFFNIVTQDLVAFTGNGTTQNNPKQCYPTRRDKNHYPNYSIK